MEQAASTKETEEEGEEMDLSVDDTPENENRETNSDEEKEQLAPGPIVVQNEDGPLEDQADVDMDDGEGENAGQASAPLHPTPVTTSEERSLD